MSWGETSHVIEAPQGFSIAWLQTLEILNGQLISLASIHGPLSEPSPTFQSFFFSPKSASASREEKLYFPAVIPLPNLIYHSRQNDCSIVKPPHLLNGREVWYAAVQGVVKNWTRPSDWTTAKHKYSCDSIVLLNLGCWQDEMLLYSS